jgi:hypothetical protein
MERWNLAAAAADSIIDSFSTSVKRAVALFESSQTALEKLILPEIESALGAEIGTYSRGKSEYKGETRFLSYLLDIDGLLWEETIRQVSAIAKRGKGGMFHPGDFIILPVNVPEVKIDGFAFPVVKITDTRLIVTAAYADKVAFNFENVIFHAPMNKEYTNEGGFKASLLARYLNEYFLPSVFKEVESYLMPNCDGLKVSIPTYVEVFGNVNDNYNATNWGEKARHPYFEKCTNRIKVKESDRDDTHWWWLSSPDAASATNFCYVNNGGYAGSYGGASEVSGGVAPAICIS